MQLKNKQKPHEKTIFFLLSVFTLLIGSSLHAQDLFPPVEIVQGTFIGTTIPLRDFPTIEYNSSDPKTMTIFENRSRYNEKVNENALPYNDINTNVQDKIGGISAFALEQNFVGFDDTGATPPDSYRCRWTKSLCTCS